MKATNATSLRVRRAKTTGQQGAMRTIEVNHIYHMNCLEGMPLIPADSVDLVVTDPPFAIEFKAKRSNYNRTPSRVLDGYSDISKAEYFAFTCRWMKEVYRVLKESVMC